MQHMIILSHVTCGSCKQGDCNTVRLSTMPFDSLQHSVRRLVRHQPRSQLDAGPSWHNRFDARTCEVTPPSWPAVSDLAVCNSTDCTLLTQQRTVLAQPESPVKPPQKPTASSVGRSQVRAVVEYPCRMEQGFAAQRFILMLLNPSHPFASTSM